MCVEWRVIRFYLQQEKPKRLHRNNSLQCKSELCENEKEAQELFEPEIQTQNGFGKQLSNRTFVGQVFLHDGFLLFPHELG